MEVADEGAKGLIVLAICDARACRIADDNAAIVAEVDDALGEDGAAGRAGAQGD
jgi:hypothetical protein